MKVLWITNILFPDICAELGISSPVIGGWMKSSAIALIHNYPEIELSVATCYSGETLLKHKINNITYYCIPTPISIKYNKKFESYWKKIQVDCVPDIIHIHGTEYTHGLAYLRACGAEGVIISIQGFVSGIARYETGGLNSIDLCLNISLRDLVKGQFTMAKRGLNEAEYIKIVNHIIGRTDWDKSHVWAINPNCQYHFCNETLRKPFYSAHWELEKCEKHRIFLSQASVPIKGLHQVIKALPLVLRHYPDTKVYVAGNNFISGRGFKARMRNSTYSNYIRRLLKDNNVEDKFVFTGLLDESQMVEQYKKAHLFICPSSIENSPNSLGEAQLVGTPCVASYVGGIPNMAIHNENAMLYRFEEIEMLAKYICDIFSDDVLAERLSINGKIAALERHDEHTNAAQTYSIYQRLLEIKE